MPTTDGGRVVLAEGRAPAPRRRALTTLVILGLVVVVGLGGWAAARHLLSGLVAPSCTATADGQSVTYSPEQAANAATIAAISVKRGMPARAATIGIATAIQESKLRNLTVGDRDSLGLFQQRPSQGWGTPEQILDPVYAANAFYDRLVKVEGYTTRPLTTVAQQVQRSGHPEAYADHEDEAQVLASVLTGQSPGGLVCTLERAEKPGDQAAVSAALQRQLGVESARAGDGLSVRAGGTLAWAAGAWAVAQAQGRGIDAVQVADQRWDRQAGDRWTQVSPADTVLVSLATI